MNQTQDVISGLTRLFKRIILISLQVFFPSHDLINLSLKIQVYKL